MTSTRKFLKSSLWTAIIASACLPGIARADDAPAPEETPATQPAPAGPVEPFPPVALMVGRSSLIRSAWPIKRVSVTDPKVADIQVITPTQVLIFGKNSGSTDLIMWGEGEEARTASITVGVDQVEIRNELLKLLPQEKLDLRFSKDLLIIGGKLSRSAQVENLHRYLDSSNVKYLDLTTLAGVQQVQLKVMLAEANRTAIRSLGINAYQTGGSAFGGSTIGPDGGGPLNPISIGTPAGAAAGSAKLPFQFLAPTSVGSATTLFAGFPDINLQLFISALAENQYLRVLAEPNLVALSGEDASFLAGGEFPIPIVQGGGAGSSTSITIDYKEFGVRLRFRPTVLGENKIRLRVAPEVSELSNGTGAISIQGFSVPAILTRRAETTLELNSGQTFAMAGLISQETQSRATRVPGLGDLPMIGALFRSVRYQEGDTELMLLVTASIVEPGALKANPPVPGSTHSVPNDWDLYSHGQIEGAAPNKLSPADTEWLHQSGLYRLRGEGAWAGYGAVPQVEASQKH